MTDNNGRLATNNFLFIAHPGHELCVHAWLAAVRPRVFVLTDGSGNGKPSRVDSTTKVLKDVGATTGSIYGRFKDEELYQIILNAEFHRLFEIIDEFAAALVAQKAGAIAGDAIEGFNPAHDVCRLIINAAVKIARRRSGQEILNRDFLLIGRHTAPQNGKATLLRLDDAELKRKVEAARAFSELQLEVQAALAGKLLALQQYHDLVDHSSLHHNPVGAEFYRVECLRSVDEELRAPQFVDDVPFYERYGELRVAEGHYRQVIRYREHMVPLTEALLKYAHS